MRSGTVIGIVALLLGLSAGCGGGTTAGYLELPQLRETPEELGFFSTIKSARVPLPGRKVVQQSGYGPPGGAEPTDSAYITITEYEGAATRGEFQEARDKYAERYKSEQYSEIEDLTIDGRPAWALTETSVYKGKVSTVTYTAVVAYPDRTFSIEFAARKAEWQEPAYLKRVVASFEVPKKGRGKAIALMLFGLAMGGVTFFYWKIHSAQSVKG